MGNFSQTSSAQHRSGPVVLPGSWNPPQPIVYSLPPVVDPGPSARSICSSGSAASFVPPAGNASNYSLPNEPLLHSRQGQDSPGGCRAYKYRYCERHFAHESSKCRHEKEHFNSFPCPEPGCEVLSTRKDSLKRHLRLMHGIGERGTATGVSKYVIQTDFLSITLCQAYFQGCMRR